MQINDKESSITLSMYLGVKWEDSRIQNLDPHNKMDDLQGVGFPFLSFLWQPDIEIHHVRQVRCHYRFMTIKIPLLRPWLTCLRCCRCRSPR